MLGKLPGFPWHWWLIHSLPGSSAAIQQVKYLLVNQFKRAPLVGILSALFFISYALPTLSNECVLKLHALTYSKNWPWNFFIGNSFLHKPWVIEQSSVVNSDASIWKDLLMLRINMTHQSWAEDVSWGKWLIYRVTSLWEPEQKCQFKSCDSITNFTTLDCVLFERTWQTRDWADWGSRHTFTDPGGEETQRTCQGPVTMLLMDLEDKVSERSAGHWGKVGKWKKTQGIRQIGISRNLSLRVTSWKEG